jgi:ubiquitin-like 1-activating enzyme E1 B
MRPERATKNFSSLHHSLDSLDSSSLHSLGQRIFVQVSRKQRQLPFRIGIFSNLFGAQVEAEASNNSNDSDLLKTTWKQEQAAFTTLKGLRNDHEAFTAALLQKVFVDDIETLCRMEELWTSREKPVPLEIPSTKLPTETPKDDQQVWTPLQWMAVLSAACSNLLSRESEEISFDKDDAETLDFVAAAANLRAACFAIELKSRFDIKAVAGNIIPAIASTNALAAAQMIVHAANLLSQKHENLGNAFINYGGGRRNVFTCEQLCPPNPFCPVCGEDRATLLCNTKEFKISDVLQQVLPRYPIPFEAEDVSLLEGSRLLYDIDDDAGNSQKTLTQLGVEDSRFLKVDIYGQKALILAIIDDPGKSGASFDLSDIDLSPNRQVRKPSSDDHQSASEADSDALELVESDLEIIPEAKKTKIEASRSAQ